MQKILNVVVCYQNENEIINYCRELEHQYQSNRIVFVVSINKISNDKNYRILKQELKKSSINTYIYSTGNNLGYLSGLLFGYNKFCHDSKDTNFQFIIFSNTDIQYIDFDFFKKLSLTKYDKDILCIGPSVYDPKQKSYRNPYIIKRYRKLDLILRNIMFDRIYLADIISFLKRKLNRKKNSKLDSQFTYGVLGCYFILKPELVNKLFDYYPWELLYGEELLISEIIRTCKKKCYYDSNLEVIHNTGSVTSLQKKSKIRKMIVKSNKRILKEFY